MQTPTPYMLWAEAPNTRYMGTRLAQTVNGKNELAGDFFVKNRLISGPPKDGC
jgi:hypothetical protein